MKILIIGLGAFGFAIAKHLAQNNPEQQFEGYCSNDEIINSIKIKREHAYFFSGKKLPNNVNIDNKINNIEFYDVVIFAIPSKAVPGIIKENKNNFKPGVIIVNLSKGIINETLQTIHEITIDILEGKKYKYAVLSGGMIASELINGNPLGADIGVEDNETGEILKKLFQSEKLNINLNNNIRNIELYGSLKNIMAILTGYYYGKGYSESTIGKYVSEYYIELKQIVILFGGNNNFDFGSYSLGGDIIATCFGPSRNREFGRLLGLGLTKKEALEEMKKQNKYVEGYRTLKAVYKKIEKLEGFKMTKDLYKLINN